MLIFNAILSLWASLLVLIKSREIVAAIFISFASYWLMAVFTRTSETSSILEIFVVGLNLLYVLAFRRYRINYYQVIYLCFALYTLLLSLVFNTPRGIILSVLCFGPLFFSMVVKKTDQKVDFIVFLLLLMGMYLRIFNTYVYGLEFLLSRYDSSVWGVNSIGAVLLILAPFIIRKWVWLCFSVFILLTLSRGLIVVWLIQEIVLNLFRLRKRFKGVYVLGCLCLIFALGYSNSLRSELLSRFFESDKADFLSAYTAVLEDERTNIRKVSLDMWTKRPIFGSGIGSFSRELKNTGYPSVYSNAHNLYLTLLVELGIVGLLIFSTYAAVMLKNIKYNRFRISILSWLVYGLFSGEMYAEGLYLSFFPIYFVFYVAKISKTH